MTDNIQRIKSIIRGRTISHVLIQFEVERPLHSTLMIPESELFMYVRMNIYGEDRDELFRIYNPDLEDVYYIFGVAPHNEVSYKEFVRTVSVADCTSKQIADIYRFLVDIKNGAKPPFIPSDVRQMEAKIQTWFMLSKVTPKARALSGDMGEGGWDSTRSIDLLDHHHYTLMPYEEITSLSESEVRKKIIIEVGSKFKEVNDIMGNGTNYSGKMSFTPFVCTPLKPERGIFNNPATIVFWNDGTKTVVKCSENDTFTEEGGFTAALAKKMYTSGGVRRILKEAKVEKE